MKWRQVAAVFCVLWSVPLLAGSGEDLQTGEFNSSEICGECHEEIYKMWKRSMHSSALSDPIFEASFLKAYWETRGEAQQVCLRCHAPIAAATGDLNLHNPVSREGVTCDYCHSVVSVDLGRQASPFEIALDGAKRGPLADAESPVHGVVKSELHETAEFCAGCHEYTNENGLAILSTYTEWKASPQAKEGKTCQHCHMPLTPGATVRSEFAHVDRESINLHNISGMHSTEQVRKAATTKIVGIDKNESNLAQVEVEVVNSGSGHSIPTGLPTRKLALEVVLYVDGKEVRRFERIYQKMLLDENGDIITEDHRAMLGAHKVLDDNRLRPGERRRERFHAVVPPKGTLEAEARLRYIYEPEVFSRERISIEIASDTYGRKR
jgi:nitrate/TMAO reductase-like tetraheme cytochrome c subunit